MSAHRAPLEQLRRWRQAAVWAPVLWFPIILTAFALDELRLVVNVLCGFRIRTESRGDDSGIR